MFGDIMNFKDKLKLEGWYLINDPKRVKRHIKQFLHILKLEETEYYDEFDKYYKTLDVKNKLVVDLGSDIGASPMYFINNGANTVIGFSKEKAYFHNKNYIHVFYSEFYKNTVKETVEYFSVFSISSVLKVDCEGCEWELSKDFIEQFKDWIIAVHNPIKNKELFEYITENGNLIGKPEGNEFGIYQKKKGD